MSLFSVLNAVVNSIKETEEIFSRNKAMNYINDIISSSDKYIFGLEKRDSMFSSLRTRWFLTETKVRFITNTIKNTYIDTIDFSAIEEVTILENDSFTIHFRESEETQTFEINYPVEQEFAYQFKEQVHRYNTIIDVNKENTEQSN